MWAAAASELWTILASIGGTTATILTAIVGYRAYKAKAKVAELSLGQRENRIGLESLQAALARTDIDAARARAEIIDLRSALVSEQTQRMTDNRACDEKIRKLGTIVKSLGGEVPDELNHLHG